jgi:hypothetical protein
MKPRAERGRVDELNSVGLPIELGWQNPNATDAEWTRTKDPHRIIVAPNGRANGEIAAAELGGYSSGIDDVRHHRCNGTVVRAFEIECAELHQYVDGAIDACGNIYAVRRGDLEMSQIL